MISEYSPCSKCASGRETKIFAYKIYFIQQKFKEIKLRRKKKMLLYLTWPNVISI